jgi:phage gp29-like protein
MDGLERMVQDAVAVIDDDQSAQLIEAGGKTASSDLYKSLCEYCDTQISKGVLGQTLTTEMSSSGGSYGASQTHQEVRHDIISGDRKIVEGAMNQLIRWIIDINFGPGAYPKFSLYHEADVDKPLAERDEILSRLGVKFAPTYIQGAYNFKREDFTISEPAPPEPGPFLPPGAPPGPIGALPRPVAPVLPAPGPVPEAAAFAARRGVRVLSPHALTLHFAKPAEADPDQLALDQVVDSLKPEQLQGFAEGLLKPVWPILEKGGTPEQIAEGLTLAYAKMDDQAFETLMAQALFVTEMFARLQAEQEGK